jgi:hypothetical protein
LSEFKINGSNSVLIGILIFIWNFLSTVFTDCILYFFSFLLAYIHCMGGGGFIVPIPNSLTMYIGYDRPRDLAPAIPSPPYLKQLWEV